MCNETNMYITIQYATKLIRTCGGIQYAGIWLIAQIFVKYIIRMGATIEERDRKNIWSDFPCMI